MAADDLGNLYSNTYYVDTSTYIDQPHVVKISNTGALLYTKKLTGSGWSQNNRGVSYKNNALYLNGVNGTGSNQWNYVLKTNPTTGAVLRDTRVQWLSVASEDNFGACADASDNTYIKGSYYDFGSGTRKGMMARVNSSNALSWARGSGGDAVGGNIYFANNSLYINWNGAILKTDNSGTMQISKYTELAPYAWDWAVDNSGNIYGSTQTSVQKYDSSINGVWKITISGMSSPGQYDLHTQIDSAGNSYSIWYMSGSKQAYIIKISSAGVVQWQRSIAVTKGGSAMSLASNQKQVSATIMANGDLAISASFSNNPRFAQVILKVPADGSKTGTYSVVNGGETYAITYAAETYTTTSATPSTSTYSIGWFDYTGGVTASTGSPSYVDSNITELTKADIT